MTHRQFEVWQAWLELQLNEPSRSDYYLMRVGQSIAGGKLDEYRVRFIDKKPNRAQSAEEQDAIIRCSFVAPSPRPSEVNTAT